MRFSDLRTCKIWAYCRGKTAAIKQSRKDRRKRPHPRNGVKRKQLVSSGTRGAERACPLKWARSSPPNPHSPRKQVVSCGFSCCATCLNNFLRAQWTADSHLTISIPCELKSDAVWQSGPHLTCVHPWWQGFNGPHVRVVA